MIFDYPIQKVTPSWSPDENKFVFGSGEFGLEVYDIGKSRRRLLTSPRYDLYHPKWSPTGEWIAARRYGDRDNFERIYILSSDGSLNSYVELCEKISAYLWSPEEDKLAILCYEGAYNYLWLWDIE
ncbi:MAG: hypothetical protein PVF83_03665 [Anaerolineales bacterium]|jgi:Tol biopolymer transport system component